MIAARGLGDMFFYTGDVPRDLQTILGIRDGILGRHDVWLTELTNCIREETAHRRAEVPFAKFATPDGKQTSDQCCDRSRKTRQAPHTGWKSHSAST